MAERYKIGLVADTHDVDDPGGVIEELGRRGCDFNVHLGDIGGSRLVMGVVREFKQYLGSADHLPPEERRRYLESLGRGTSPLRAYVESRLAPDTIPQRVAETGAAYRAVLSRMARLPNPILLRGNVDGMQLRAEHVQACFAESALALETRPRIVDLDWLAMVLWPSWRPANRSEEAELAEATTALVARAATKSRVVVLAHEQLFKGPDVTVYAARVARAGLQQLSVPRFDPNPAWRCLLRFFRAMPPATRCCFVFGHVHDSLDVMAAGAPALRNPTGPGLRYRLHGLAWRGERGSIPRGVRRSITMLPVAVNEVGLLTVSRGDLCWDVVRYRQSCP